MAIRRDSRGRFAGGGSQVRAKGLKARASRRPVHERIMNSAKATRVKHGLPAAKRVYAQKRNSQFRSERTIQAGKLRRGDKILDGFGGTQIIRGNNGSSAITQNIGSRNRGSVSNRDSVTLVSRVRNSKKVAGSH